MAPRPSFHEAVVFDVHWLLVRYTLAGDTPTLNLLRKISKAFLDLVDRYRNHAAEGQAVCHGLVKHLRWAPVSTQFVVRLAANRTADLTVVDENGDGLPFWLGRYGLDMALQAVLTAAAFSPERLVRECFGAAWRGHLECVRLFVEAEMDMSYSNEDGYSPLGAAARYVIDVLIGSRAHTVRNNTAVDTSTCVGFCLSTVRRQPSIPWAAVTACHCDGLFVVVTTSIS